MSDATTTSYSFTERQLALLRIMEPGICYSPQRMFFSNWNACKRSLLWVDTIGRELKKLTAQGYVEKILRGVYRLTEHGCKARAMFI